MSDIAIAIMANSESLLDRAKKLSSELHIPLLDHETPPRLLLTLSEAGLSLKLTNEKAVGPVRVDFLNGALAHRRQYGGGRGQLLARAIGLSSKKSKKTVSVLDLTAGLGRDAFVLAHLNCDVTMVERHPIIAALLRDGLQRGEQEAWFRELSLQLIEDDAQLYLKSLTPQTMPDVIYLDPMYPERKKSALVKKEMRILRELVGDDHDADDCLALALSLPAIKKRIVVKRPRLAPPLNGPEPSVVFSGKSSRFDVYLS